MKLAIQWPCKDEKAIKDLVVRDDLKKWVLLALLPENQKDAQLTLRFVDASESQILNRDYRGKDYATNVLTFAYQENDEDPVEADIVICPQVVVREAHEQDKPLWAHLVHLVVHGVLHAQGFDHMTDQEAQEMEKLEIQCLQSIGVDNPYQE